MILSLLRKWSLPMNKLALKDLVSDLPGVVFILPDSYIDPVNKEYGGDKYENGVITHRPPPVQNTRMRPRPRFDRSTGGGGPQNYQRNPQYGQQPPMQGGGGSYGSQQIARSTTKNLISSHSSSNLPSILVNLMSTKPRIDEDKWNDAWESAWLPDDLTDKSRAPWEKDVNFDSTAKIEETDVEANAFVEDMNEHWNERRGKKSGKVDKREVKIDDGGESSSSSLYSLETMKKDYRLKKQRVHASLWVKEIEKLEEAKLGDSGSGGGADDIDRLLDSCSEIFDSVDHDFDKLEVSSGSEMKNKPDGWESTAKEQDGNLWEMSQREEDILLQEFDRRTAFCKFQIASFIKQHIFSRRRPIDGWRYMIEVIGSNARKGKGSVSRLPALSDVSTQPFKEETGSLTTLKR
ncbi:PREDICTED: uncharacterized protein LOC104731530 isoform X7 [Camelina sativa]|uniref:Uncharacterized protein LOC104731530 isoform X5 n=1 Tax=Camelina sativa TaxID=90675 RepID=A0ABM0V139_CAMSA|nr:PREDICTED: uncharacterized protein LOC104731530 isoform X5 [Camelina sativa]XP_010449248.1 PREDICTED: uncharacterized protein LOC104731530 isoform X6 [Camelina sativa]XP_010449250.1 PREDICTED: uncharacterized protein LOC104731530 isoform X7 [Camelina sativa]